MLRFLPYFSIGGGGGGVLFCDAQGTPLPSHATEHGLSARRDMVDNKVDNMVDMVDNNVDNMVDMVNDMVTDMVDDMVDDIL